MQALFDFVPVDKTVYRKFLSLSPLLKKADGCSSSSSSSSAYPDFSLDTIDSMIHQQMLPQRCSFNGHVGSVVVAEVKRETSNRLHFTQFPMECSSEEAESSLPPPSSPPFPSHTLQSPVSDLLPAFDWAAPVDWTELASDKIGDAAVLDCVAAADDDLKVLGVDLDALMFGNGSGFSRQLEMAASSSSSSSSFFEPGFISSSSSSGSESDSSQTAVAAPTVVPSAAVATTRQEQRTRHHNHPLVSLVLFLSRFLVIPSNSDKSLQNVPLQMACHDYTNKLSYTMATMKMLSTAAAAAAVGHSNRSVATGIRTIKPTKVTVAKKTVAVKRCAGGGGGCGGGGGNRAARIPKSESEDKDYLAHGTGIPRCDKPNIIHLIRG
jgi:hypothetical protein